MKAIDTSKEAIKSRIEALAANPAWQHPITSQFTAKLAVGLFWLELLEIKEQKERDAALKAWMNTPNGFGANASQLMQELGLRAKASESKKEISGF